MMYIVFVWADSTVYKGMHVRPQHFTASKLDFVIRFLHFCVQQHFKRIYAIKYAATMQKIKIGSNVICKGNFCKNVVCMRQSHSPKTAYKSKENNCNCDHKFNVNRGHGTSKTTEK